MPAGPNGAFAGGFECKLAMANILIGVTGILG